MCWRSVSLFSVEDNEVSLNIVQTLLQLPILEEAETRQNHISNPATAAANSEKTKKRVGRNINCCSYFSCSLSVSRNKLEENILYPGPYWVTEKQCTASHILYI